ncbi:protein-glutamate methylesterase/protein-glutamine glutaminase [Curvivirga sp.]|uniref:protein-glutamate methylesterase/protein-glutamine glutaminase n=1 Tax=Curvivirga sp. TaxID=2856848 RepID=UPI003B5BA236
MNTNASSESSNTPIKVMVVDDALVIRGLITRFLEAEGDIEIVASVGDGERALQALDRHPVDVVVLDIEMPRMDGLTALPKIIEKMPGVQVLMASTLTRRNAEVSLKALSLGAADYVPKPTSNTEIGGKEDFKREIIGKVRALGKTGQRRRAIRERSGAVPTGARGTSAYARQEKLTSVNAFKAASESNTRRPFTARQTSDAPSPTARPSSSLRAEATKSQKSESKSLYSTPASLRQAKRMKPDIITIGSSTGGPQALFKVLSNIGPDVKQPILITQHMPPTFTTILAEHVAKASGRPTKEAEDGEEILPGHIYIAAGDYHMLVKSNGLKKTLHKDHGPQENFCRPAVDPMLRSVVEVYGANVLTVILTGMGSDGKKGCEHVVNAGGQVIAQDEETSVVWGMPGAVATAGLCSFILPVDEVGPKIRSYATGGLV